MPTQKPSSNNNIFDIPSALERAGGDYSFLKELIDLYIEEFSTKLNQLKKAIAQKNFLEIQEIGHSLKGSSGNLSLSSLQEASYEVEKAGKEKDITKSEESTLLLENEFKRLKGFLETQEEFK
ncbi:MAG: Hpt domain-containing protein [Acidobacteriota bacterium]|nr:Hpt domain-containing protein [Acidobacteriota bacterium]